MSTCRSSLLGNSSVNRMYRCSIKSSRFKWSSLYLVPLMKPTSGLSNLDSRSRLSILLLTLMGWIGEQGMASAGRRAGLLITGLGALGFTHSTTWALSMKVGKQDGFSEGHLLSTRIELRACSKVRDRGATSSWVGTSSHNFTWSWRARSWKRQVLGLCQPSSHCSGYYCI